MIILGLLLQAFDNGFVLLYMCVPVLQIVASCPKFGKKDDLAALSGGG